MIYLNYYVVSVYFVVFMSRDEMLLEKIYREVVAIRKRLEILERIIIPEEEISEEELNELRKLKQEALKGEIISWDEVKEEFRDKVED